ncbi:TIGR02281 family clan AA aspartic protease [Sphingomonas rosea]|uniref:TIGR02281 family clan AA aspartic protease n=1 Tax=Sphingomonas rosea TaxID=335605 RepID=A0ABP7UDB5_9SPHN
MSDGQAPNALYLLIAIIFVGMSLFGRGMTASKTLKMVLAWVAVFAAFFAIFAFRGEFGALGARLKSEAMGEAAPIASGETYRIPKRDDGHFWVDGKVNGKTVRFLVDSGATTTTLSADAAKAAGLEAGMRGDFVGTANGEVFMPRVTAGLLEVGAIRRADMSVNINPNDGTSVLGMNFLSSLRGWAVEGDNLVLKP